MNYGSIICFISFLWFHSDLCLYVSLDFGHRVIHQSREGIICIYIILCLNESFCCWVLSCLDLIDYNNICNTTI